MSLFNRIAGIFGGISVREAGNLTRISGIDGLVMRKHFSGIFHSDLISRQMFTQVTSSSLILNKFFVPDLIYMLERVGADPKTPWSAKRTCSKMVDRLKKYSWYNTTLGEIKSITDPTRLNLIKWNPLPKQEEFVHLYGDKLPRYGLNGYILGAAPGTGKSLSALIIAICLVPPRIAEVKIIISPKKAVNLVWEKTIQAVFKTTPKYWVASPGAKIPTSDIEYYVFNYEQLDNVLALAKYLSEKKKQFFIIVDESHNFADAKSGRTQKLVDLQLLKDSGYFLWLSGSPILKTAGEMTSYLKSADPRFDADAEKRFRKIYTVAPGKANEIFNHRFGEMMAFLVPKAEVYAEKPTVKELPIRLSPALSHKYLMSTVKEEMKVFITERLLFYKDQVKENKEIVSRWLTFHESTLKTRGERQEFQTYQKNLKLLIKTPDLMLLDIMRDAKAYERTKLMPSLPPTEKQRFRSALSAIKNIKLKVRGEALGKVLSKRRSECAATLALFCQPEIILKESLSKTLFFSSSILPIKVLEKSLKDQGFQPLMVYGGTNSQLVSMMEKFDTDPDINPICATMQSLSEAVPVTSASTVVLLNRPFRQANWDQIVSRASRLGQQYPVTVIEVTLDTGDELNVSTRTDQILGEVRELINTLVGEAFSGPDPDEREYQQAIEISSEDPIVLWEENKLEL